MDDFEPKDLVTNELDHLRVLLRTALANIEAPDLTIARLNIEDALDLLPYLKPRDEGEERRA